MEAFDLDPNILHAIFQQHPINPQAVKDLQEWQHNLEPSFTLLKSILEQYFAQNNYSILSQIVTKIDTVLVSLQELKCPKMFLRALLAILKTHWQQIEKKVDPKVVLLGWKSISPQIIEFYFQTFGIIVDTVQNKENTTKLKLSLEEYEARIMSLIEKKEYDNAMILIKLIGYPEALVKTLLQKMANNKDASKAANLIKTHKIDPKLVPKVGERLNKNMVRYFLKNHGWQITQQIFDEQPQALAYMVEDLIFKNKTKQALSLWFRHKDIVKFIVKQNSLDFLKEQTAKSEEEITNQIIQNQMFSDYFGPSNLEQYLTLKEFGIERNQVVWVDATTHKQMENLIQQIAQSDILAIDTESIVGQTKLQRNKYESASIVQIAFSKKVFVLDGLTCKNKDLQKAMKDYIQRGQPILGHAITNDLNSTLFAFGFTENEISMMKFNTIDTCNLFKVIYPKQKYSNLAYICKKVLQKEVCKQQTLTNWARRPLRENQLHYAAMDAFCLLKIYEILREQVGANMLNYFLNKDFQ